MGRLLTALAALVALLVVLAAGWVIVDFAQTAETNDSVASLTGVYNDVTFRQAKTLVWEQGEPGTRLRVRDAVRTAANARAVIRYVSGLSLNVDPSSLVVITAPRTDERGREMQEVVVQAGGVAGRVDQGQAGPVVRIVDGQGVVAASLAASSAGAPLSYRVRLDEAGGTEIAVLEGSAEVESGGETVSVTAGQALAVAAGPEKKPVRKVVTLPPFPRSVTPEADAQLTLEGAAAVNLTWSASPGAATYHVQVGRGFTFEDLAADAGTEATSFAFAVDAPGTYFWRVSSIDAEGREGEHGYVRRFTVLSPPGDEPVAAPEGLEPLIPLEPLPEVAQEEQFDFKARVLGRGLLRQGLGAGAFTRISGKVELFAKDVLKAERGAGVNLGRESVVALNTGSEVVLARAGTRTGRRVLALDLRRGAVLADLGRGAALASVYVEAQGVRVAVHGEKDGGRARTERTDEGLRIVSERGETEVWAKGRKLVVPEGHAVLVPKGGEPSELLPLPPTPDLRVPAQDARYLTLDSPPQIGFEWKAVTGVSAYRVLISEDPEGGALVYDGTTERTRLTYGALRPGAYWWTVQSVDPRGLESLGGHRRSLTVTKDTIPPQVTVHSPQDGTVVGGDQVVVTGQTEEGAKLKINGRTVEVTPSGAFESAVRLGPGLNQIVIEAVDRANNVTFQNLKVRKEQ